MHPAYEAVSRGLLAVVVLTLVGCGSSATQTVPVKGTVTLAGGPWPKAGSIQFNPVAPAPGFPLRPGSGSFKTDGTFQVTSFAPGDGLVPGKYEVSVECWEVEPQMSPTGENTGKSAVPEKYRTGKNSTWVLEVPPGSGPLDVKYDATR